MYLSKKSFDTKWINWYTFLSCFYEKINYITAISVMKDNSLLGVVNVNTLIKLRNEKLLEDMKNKIENII